MQLLQIIKQLAPKLPGKDGKLALKFLEKRDFESIYELVKSDIYLTEKNATKEVPSEKYANVDLDELVELREALENYMDLISTPDELDDLCYEDTI